MTKLSFVLILAFSFATEVACGASPLVQTLQLLDTEPQQVKIEAVQNDRLQYRVATSSSDFGDVQDAALSDVVSWGRRRSFRTASQVLLSDGGVIIADLLAVAPDRWTWGADPLAFGSVRPVFRKVLVPRDLIAGAIFTPPGDPARRDELASEIRSFDKDDLWWIERGNQVKGRLLQVQGPADSDALGAGAGIGQWVVRVRQRSIVIDHSRVQSLRLAQSAAPETPDGLRWRLGFSDGSFVLVESLSEQDGVMHLRLSGDAVAQMDRDEFYENLCLVRPFNPRVHYLADDEPREHRHQPFLTLKRQLQRNRSVLGHLPRYRDFVFTKSLGVSSRSFVVYDIPDADEPWKRLAAEVALDRAAKDGGSVVFRVFAQTDDDRPWQRVAATETVRAEDPPQTLRISLDQVRRVALMVDYADNGDVLDYANWLNLRLER